MENKIYNEEIFLKVVEEMGLKLNPNPDYDYEIAHILELFSDEYIEKNYTPYN